MSMSKELIFSMEDEQEAPQSEELSGFSRDDHIHEFLRLDALIKELSAEKRNHVSALTEFAAAERNGQKSVHLEAHDGARVKVEFKTDYECDVSELEAIKELVKDEQFNELFKATYTPIVKNLKMFMNTGFTDEPRTIAKELLKEAVKEVDKTPYISAERSR